MHTKPNFGSAAVQAAIYLSFCLGLLVCALWSLDQTIQFCIAVTTPTIGPFIGLVTQFGQNFALFMAHRAHDRLEKAGWIAGFAFCAFVDAATNMGQWNKEHAGETNWFVLGTGYSICFLVVFVEEVLAPSIAAFLHHLNELQETVTGKSIPTLEWAAQTSQRFGPGRPQSQASPP